jgi:hypothetical protein
MQAFIKKSLKFFKIHQLLLMENPLTINPNTTKMFLLLTHFQTLSKDLKKEDFKFVGSTIIPMHTCKLQVWNDHLEDCFIQKDQKKWVTTHKSKILKTIVKTISRFQIALILGELINTNAFKQKYQNLVLLFTKNRLVVRTKVEELYIRTLYQKNELENRKQNIPF